MEKMDVCGTKVSCELGGLSRGNNRINALTMVLTKASDRSMSKVYSPVYCLLICQILIGNELDRMGLLASQLLGRVEIRARRCSIPRQSVSALDLRQVR